MSELSEMKSDLLRQMKEQARTLSRTIRVANATAALASRAFAAARLA